MNRLVHNNSAKGCASLARGAKAGEQGTLDGEIEVRARRDHQRILAAQFQARGLQVASGERADLSADRRRAGESHLVQEPAFQRLL